jgi:hypothetical protein
MGPGLRKPVRYMRLSVLCEADIGELFTVVGLLNIEQESALCEKVPNI